MPTQQEIDKVIESTDMVDLVSPYVKLTKQGKNYKGLCPFHNEDTPSFVVSQEKHIAHCFGCGKGGNPINFLMQIKQISFNEALNELAKKNGIKLTNSYVEKKKQDYTKYYEMMQVAAKFYSKNLFSTKSGLEALEYLHKRGLNDETIKMFQIGLAPVGIDSLYNVLKDANYLELDMMDVGLINKNDKGYHDVFIKRIMFPICDEMGNIIGFSGRIFNNNDPNQPKYVNTKETFLYKKGSVFYHLDLAKSEILRKKRVILHEGQMDVIAATNAGFKEAVCAMGTAITIEQAQVLKKYTTQAILCYDADKAGINASKKAIQVLKKVGIDSKLVLLPNGMDPDEFISKYGVAEYCKYFDSNILDEYQYYFEIAFLNKDLNDFNQIEALKLELFQVIANLSSQTGKEVYLKKLSEKLSSSYNSILNDFNSYCNSYSREEFVENYYPNDYFIQGDVNLQANNQFKKNYELRLLMYARASKEKAYLIDSQISDYLEGISEANRSIWISLINDYYVNNEIFNDAKFCSILSEDMKNIYLNNLELIKNSIEIYNDDDLNACIKKVIDVDLDIKNKKISNQIMNSNDNIYKLKKIQEKFNNKKVINNRRK